jgi:hypothetical protein
MLTDGPKDVSTKNNSLRMIMKFDRRTQVKESLWDAERAADDRKSQYEQVVLMTSDILWRYDLGLNGESVDSYISHVADRMLGLPDGTIKDSFDKFLSYVHPDDLPAVQDALSDAIRMPGKGQKRRVSSAKVRRHYDLGSHHGFCPFPPRWPGYCLWHDKQHHQAEGDQRSSAKERAEVKDYF